MSLHVVVEVGWGTATIVANALEAMLDAIVETYREVHEDDLKLKEIEVEVEEAESRITSIVKAQVHVPTKWGKEKIEDYVQQVADIISDFIGDAVE